MSLNEKLEYIELEFDSYDTDISFNNNYTSTNWPLFRLGRPISNIVYMKIVSAEIPFSYYVINQYNNNFKLVINTTQYSLTIPVGNYTGNSLSAAIGLLLPGIITVAYTSSTNKLTFTCSTVAVCYLIFGNSSDDGSTNPRFAMGFGSGNSTTFQTGSPLIAPYVVQISGPNYIYINSTSYGQSFNLFLGEGALNNGLNGPQLCKF